MKTLLAVFLVLLAALFAAPASAADEPRLDLATWVSEATDLAVEQVALAGPENVYSLEPLGPPTPAAEVVALVRAEAIAPDWSARHRFRSWDAHILFDCSGRRLRVLRSASYAGPARSGAASPAEPSLDWIRPDPATPAAVLLDAACNSAFAWPLRSAPAAAPTPGPEPQGPPIVTAEREPEPIALAAVHLERDVASSIAVAAPAPRPARVELAVHGAALEPGAEAALAPTILAADLPRADAAAPARASRPGGVLQRAVGVWKRLADVGRSWIGARSPAARSPLQHPGERLVVADASAAVDRWPRAQSPSRAPAQARPPARAPMPDR